MDMNIVRKQKADLTHFCVKNEKLPELFFYQLSNLWAFLTIKTRHNLIRIWFAYCVEKANHFFFLWISWLSPTTFYNMNKNEFKIGIIFFSDHSRFWYLWWIVPKAINYSRKYIWWRVWRRLGYRKRKWCWFALWRSKFQPWVRTASQGDCQATIVKKATKCDSIHEGSSQYWWWSRSHSFSKFLP